MQRTKWALAFVMMVFGLLLSTQLRIQQQVPPDRSSPRYEDLAAELKVTQELLQTAERDRDRLQAELERLQNAGSSTAAATQEKIRVEMLAGTRPLSGPGVIVMLTEDPESAVTSGVQDEDLWLVVNELLSAGAEGVAINGQRITALSGIRNVGSRIIIYQTMTASPFEVAAIGDPAVLEAALKMRGGVAETLHKYGIRVTIVRSDKILLPAVKTLPEFRHAKPAK